MGPNILQNVNGQIRPSPDALPDCSKGASSNVCKVSAALDQLTIRANRGKIAVQAHKLSWLLPSVMHTALLSRARCMQNGGSLVYHLAQSYCTYVSAEDARTLKT